MPLPDTEVPTDPADQDLLLRANRLSLIHGSAPFLGLQRSRAVPEPYQLVPLLMAMGRDRVRLLIGDDVGIGKTVEAGLILAELLARGLVRRVLVVVPANLREQWQESLERFFHIGAVVVAGHLLPALERSLLPGQSPWEVFPFVVVSIDYAKRHPGEILAARWDMAIVDECHIAARPHQVSGRSAEAMQRHEFLSRLSKAVDHLVLLSATPHNGYTDSFASLVEALNPAAVREDRLIRESARQHIIQRRRRDIEAWYGDRRPFPRRDEPEHVINIANKEKDLFARLREYTDRLEKRGPQAINFWVAAHFQKRALSSPRALRQSLKNRRDAINKRLDDMREGRGDFYPYRYLGLRGFLPNYAFPRRASTAFFNDRRESVARAPTLALREFAPLNSIYYRGRRYRVERVQPRTRGQGRYWAPLKTCECGYFFLGDSVAQSGACPSCGRGLMARHAYQNALEIPDPVASRRGRISADEEERQRRGFDIAPFYKAGSSERRGSLVAGGEPVAEFSYVRQGELLLANFGFRQGRDPRFQLCEACGAWLSSEEGADRHVTEEGRWRCPAGGTQEDLRRDVVLYTQGFHDMVFLDAPAPSDELAESFGWSLVYALSSGFQVAYSADAAELGGFLFDHPTDSSLTRVLLYETDEGGSGLLNHLTEPDAWRRVATRVLEILHVDPASGEDMPGACEKACYDCLLSFYNQPYHDLLDRRQVVPFLSSLLDPQVELMGGDERWAKLEEHGVGTEPRVIQRMRRLGFPVPDGQHRIVRTPAGIPVTEADLFYEPNLVVWIHGVPHEKQYVRERDERLRRELKGLGYRPIEVWWNQADEGLRQLALALGWSDLASRISI